jgi:hypothetical protein
MRVPLPEGTAPGSLRRQGARPDALGHSIESTIEDGLLTFQARPEWGLQHLFLVPKA